MAPQALQLFHIPRKVILKQLEPVPNVAADFRRKLPKFLSCCFRKEEFVSHWAKA